MSEYNKYNAACPDDFKLVEYKEGNLPTEERQQLTEHLLLCRHCLFQLELLPWNTVEEMKAATANDSDAEEEANEAEISPILKRAFDIYRKKLAAEPKAKPRTLQEVLADGGLEVGQIWRTKNERIAVPLPDGEEKLSVSHLGSIPHLVVVSNTSVETRKFLGKMYHVIKVIPVDDNIHYESNGDVVFLENENPLKYPFMLAIWNQQETLRENLDSCLGKLDAAPVSLKTSPNFRWRDILDFLTEKGFEPVSNAAFSLFGIIEKNFYSDAAMRHRAREFENTAYLRAPVRELHNSLEKARATTEEIEVSAPKPAGTLGESLQGVFQTLRGSWGDLREEITFNLGLSLKTEPQFSTASAEPIRYKTEDELCEIAVREKENGDLSVLVSSKLSELADREIVLEAVGVTLSAPPQKLKPFDENWFSTEFIISFDQRKNLPENGKLQIKLVE